MRGGLDFNGDGFPDLAIALSSVPENPGDSTDNRGALLVRGGADRSELVRIRNPTPVVDGRGLSKFGDSFYAVDINADGIDDLRIAAERCDPPLPDSGTDGRWWQMLTYLGDATGKIPAPIFMKDETPSAARSWQMVIDDFDGDGHPDEYNRYRQTVHLASVGGLGGHSRRIEFEPCTFGLPDHPTGFESKPGEPISTGVCFGAETRVYISAAGQSEDCPDWIPMRGALRTPLSEDVTGDGRADLLGLVHVAPAQMGVPVGHSAVQATSFLFVIAGSRDGLQRRELVRIPEQGELASLGDTNGDGYGDIVAVHETSLIIYLGGPDGLSADRVRRIEPPTDTWFRPKTITSLVSRD